MLYWLLALQSEIIPYTTWQREKRLGIDKRNEKMIEYKKAVLPPGDHAMPLRD